MLRLLRDRGTRLDFLHIDALRLEVSPEREVFGGELLQLSDLAERYRLAFGVIIWGDNGEADVLYAADAIRSATEVGRVFRSWEVMPDHLIIQSWALSRTGRFITPSNLPETAPYTHTALVNQIYAMLRGTNTPRR
jgi:hypothetical protein